MTTTRLATDDELLDMARLNVEAVAVVADSLRVLNKLDQTEFQIQQNAGEIIARLAHANILLDRYERPELEGDETTNQQTEDAENGKN